MHLPSAISTEIAAQFAPHIEDNPSDYVCIYGSSVYSQEKTTSDVDLLVVTHGAGTLAIEPVVGFIRDLHQRHGRRIDEEVPYENKVHYTDTEIESALQFGGFEVDGQAITVPAVRKETAFLESPAIKARLILNCLTTPHAVIGRDLARYDAVREKAGEAVTLLAISLLGQKEFNIPSLYDVLTVSERGATGEMFLGYKTEYPLVANHLYGVLRSGIDRLTENGVISAAAQGHEVDWTTFNPHGYMQIRTAQK